MASRSETTAAAMVIIFSFVCFTVLLTITLRLRTTCGTVVQIFARCTLIYCTGDKDHCPWKAERKRRSARAISSKRNLRKNMPDCPHGTHTTPTALSIIRLPFISLAPPPPHPLVWIFANLSVDCVFFSLCTCHSVNCFPSQH